MSLFSKLCLKTKIATVCFVLGKMSFVPSVCFLFLGEYNKSLISISIYISLIVSSIVFSLMAMKSKNIDTSLLAKKIEDSEDSEISYTVKIKDGKIVSIV